MLLEERIDAVEIAIVRNCPVLDRLEETAICQAAAPPFEDQPLMCYDRDDTMDGKNVDIVSSETPNSKCTAEGSDAITSGLWNCYLNAARMYMQ